MTQILHGADLVEKPYDPFWDGNPTRREMQKVFNKLGANDAELMGMADTAAIVLNFLCEELKITKPQIDAYVERKKAELDALRAKLKEEAAKQ